MGTADALEQRVSKPAKYLRAHRFRITLWIAAPEGLLVVLGVIPHLAIYVLAVLAIAFWFSTARRYNSPAARQVSWIFAASQALAVLVPIVLIVAKWAAVTVIAIIAVIALVFLFAERERG
jgi:FtsH-binding integral membrane protein